MVHVERVSGVETNIGKTKNLYFLGLSTGYLEPRDLGLSLVETRYWHHYAADGRHDMVFDRRAGWDIALDQSAPLAMWRLWLGASPNDLGIVTSTAARSQGY